MIVGLLLAGLLESQFSKGGGYMCRGYKPTSVHIAVAMHYFILLYSTGASSHLTQDVCPQLI
jgi:hypothetical protein